jgi:iduronate 2-sulfatase
MTSLDSVAMRSAKDAAVWTLALVVALWTLCGSRNAIAGERPNVLLILVDDLKPALGCYGDPIAKTPHMDRLAARGMRFDLSFCNQAVCAPSRFTLMLGSHSTSTGLYGLGSQLRQRLPDAVTLPQHFGKHGYHTESLGKVFHIGHGNLGDPPSFAVEHFHDKVIEYVDPSSTDGGQLTREEAYFTNQKLGQIGSLPRGAAFESPEVADEAYADGRVANEAVRRLEAARRRLESDGTPSFIAVGFARPHLPFSAPQQYWDQYDPASLPQPTIDVAPIDAPAIAGKKNGELANYKPVPASGFVDGQLRRQLIHGYYASVSFVDAQIGKLLDALDRLKLADNTIVVLWSDHGFHLGDHGLWTKHTNYEQANRTPLIIAAPGVTQNGSSTRQLAESVDIFPTLAELAGLPAPSGPQPIDGKSLVPVLRNPAVRVRDHAFHVFPRARLGRAIRTERFRLVEWRNIGDSDQIPELELYDYEADPLETRNLAGQQPEIVAQLRGTLAKYPQPVDPSATAAVARGGKAAAADTPAVPAEAAGRGNDRSDPAARHPDIVIFLTDDQGQLDCSPYGDDRIRTPNMQRLANSGMTITRAYVASPSCAPSRAALLTGLMPARNGAEANHSKPRKEIKKWPKYFQDLGYEVVSFGKVSHYRHTSDYGFDHFAHDAFHDHAAIPAAVEFLKNRRQVPQGQVKPLCLMVGSNWPHVPWPEDHPGYDPNRLPLPAGSIDTPQTRQWRARYASAVAKADDDLGAILDASREHLPPETIFLFSADHGAQWPFGKWNLYESGICVPLIVSWPGIVKGGSRSAAMVNWTDLLPTLIAAAGGKPPADIDGRSFLSVLRGESDSHRDRIFTTHANDNRFNVYPMRAVRNERWKYIRNLHPEYAFTTHIDLVAGRLGQRAFFSAWEEAAKKDPSAAAILKRYHARPAEELYDLSADPYEQRNLATDPQHTQTLATLREELDAWMKAQNDQRKTLAEPRLLSDPNAYGPAAAINDKAGR